MDGQIASQSSSYRRGLVLGLTMAEVMLLLVFCLLIGLGALLARHSSENTRLSGENEWLRNEIVRIKDANATLSTASMNCTPDQQRVIAALQGNTELYERLKATAMSGTSSEIDENWRELVTAWDIVAEAKNNGTDLRNSLSTLAELKDRGIDTKAALRDADVVSALEKVMPAGETTTADNVVKYIERGLLWSKKEVDRWPPIITLSEADGFHFGRGSAELSPEFSRTLTDTVPSKIIDIIKQFDVDIIEVVGHTDEQPVSQRQSNLDRNLAPVLKNSLGITSLTPADNAGLGLARAVAVVSVLLKSEQLAGYKLIPLSAAQLVNIDESLALAEPAGDVQERRRIEIRLRKSARKQRETGSE